MARPVAAVTAVKSGPFATLQEESGPEVRPPPNPTTRAGFEGYTPRPEGLSTKGAATFVFTCMLGGTLRASA